MNPQNKIFQESEKVMNDLHEKILELLKSVNGDVIQLPKD